ncbi:MAG: GNAT family N-acetyltransferase [Chitinophagales bacterium]|nr:GNAT family N-acetyltransferase [Chitinophagales bacterium]
MKTQPLQIDRLTTERLILIPFTMQICQHLINDDFSNILKMGFKKGKSWPDNDVTETLPRIINNLSKVEAPTGFESWMIIKKDTLEIIGDAGFKGFNYLEENIDIGYGIIKEERRNGYAEEAVSALIKWAFSTEIVKKITANCLVDNVGSIKLLKKSNFIEMKKENGLIYWSLLKKQNPKI